MLPKDMKQSGSVCVALMGAANLRSVKRISQNTAAKNMAKNSWSATYPRMKSLLEERMLVGSGGAII